MHINDLLTHAVEQGASDLHVKVGNTPMMRIGADLVPMTGVRRLTHDDTLAMATTVLPESLREGFRDLQEVDVAYSVPGLGRFRCSVFLQRGTVGLVLRVIPVLASGIEELNLPPVLRSIAMEARGLVLVTGTTGSGKSTTLAAMLDHINRNRHAHIVTIEDPIEFLHRDAQSIINQREVTTDTRSFGVALRSALRQDPDVILLGEMRDTETVQTALLAAETGHLVLSTLHTLDATETINRIIAVFPPHQHAQIRLQLASVLKSIVSQRLVPRAAGTGRCPAVEVLVSTPFIRDCIKDPDRTHLIPGAIASGVSQYGMQTFDQSLLGLVRRELITVEEALRWATNIDEFRLKLQGIFSASDEAAEQMASGVLGAAPQPPPPEITRFSR